MGNRQSRHAALVVCSRRLNHWTRRSMSAAAGLLFPPICVVCEGSLERLTANIQICGKCRAKLLSNQTCCLRCARPLPLGDAGTQQFHAAAVVRHPQRTSCPRCRNSRFKFTRTTAIGVYGGVLRETVMRMKRKGSDALTIAMGKLLAERQSRQARPDLIVPVAMHWQRRLVRGVNCPEVLAEVLGTNLRVPVADDLLTCRRKAKKQGTLLPSERRRNVRGAYQVSRGYDINRARVLLVDDVMTTGATADEIAKTLLRARAAEVSVAVAARGIGFG